MNRNDGDVNTKRERYRRLNTRGGVQEWPVGVAGARVYRRILRHPVRYNGDGTATCSEPPRTTAETTSPAVGARCKPHALVAKKLTRRRDEITKMLYVVRTFKTRKVSRRFVRRRCPFTSCRRLPQVVMRTSNEKQIWTVC